MGKSAKSQFAPQESVLLYAPNRSPFASRMRTFVEQVRHRLFDFLLNLRNSDGTSGVYGVGLETASKVLPEALNRFYGI